MSDLFEWATSAPYQRHSSTSRAAAESLTGDDLNSLQRLVFDCIKASPDGMTDEQIQRALSMNPSTERPRRIELLRKGLILESETKRKTSSGRNAAVWVSKI